MVDWRPEGPPERSPLGIGRGGSNAIWEHRLAPLRERPETWAVAHVFDSPYGASSQTALWRNGHTPFRVRGRWELRAVSRSPEPGQSELWARYLGPSDGSEIRQELANGKIFDEVMRG